MRAAGATLEVEYTPCLSTFAFGRVRCDHMQYHSLKCCWLLITFDNSAVKLVDKSSISVPGQWSTA